MIRGVRVTRELLTYGEGRARQASGRRCHMSLNEETPLGKGFQHRLGVRERSWPGSCGRWPDWGNGRRVGSGGW